MLIRTTLEVLSSCIGAESHKRGKPADVVEVRVSEDHGGERLAEVPEHVGHHSPERQGALAVDGDQAVSSLDDPGVDGAEPRFGQAVDEEGDGLDVERDVVAASSPRLRLGRDCRGARRPS